MSDDASPRDAGWHLHKRVPISIIGAILVQTIAVVWFLAGVQAQVADHERRMLTQERNTETRALRDLAQEGRLARIEEGIRSLLDTASRLERRIDGRQQP